MSNYLRSGIRAFLLTFFISLAAAFFGYLIRLVLAKNLTPADYGLFYSVFASVAIFTTFKTLGLNQALAKFIPDFTVKKQFSKLKNVIGYGLFFQFLSSATVALILILLASNLASTYFKNPFAAIILVVLALAFWMQSLESTVMAVLRGLQYMGVRASVDLVRSFLILVIAIIGFQLGYGVLGPAIAYLLAPILIFLGYGFFIRQKYLKPLRKKKWVFRKQEISSLFKFSFPVMLSGIGTQILQYTDTIILTYYTSLETVGFYNAALPTVTLLTYFSMALVTVTLPMVSEMWAKKLMVKLKEGVSAVYRYIFLLVLPFVMVLFAFPETILTILFGTSYVAAATALRILSLGIVFLTIANVTYAVFAGIGKPKITTIIVLIATVFNVITNLLLIPVYGMVGAAITTALGYVIMMVLGMVLLRKHIPYSIPIVAWIKNVLITLLIYLLIVAMKPLALFGNLYLDMLLILVIAAIIYLVAIFLFGVIEFREIRHMLDQFTKKTKAK